MYNKHSFSLLELIERRTNMWSDECANFLCLLLTYIHIADILSVIPCDLYH